MATETLRPNADGTYQEIVNDEGSGRPHYDSVDEVTPDDNGTYLRTDLDGDERDTFGLPNHSEGSGSINSLKVWARWYSDQGAAVHSGYILIVVNSTLYSSDEFILPTSYTNDSWTWTKNPSNGLDWTWEDVDNLEAGIRIVDNGAGRPRCTQVYVEVDYTAVTEKTSSDTGSGVDAVESLQTPQAKTSSDTGSGVEGTPLSSATLAGSETGSGIEALVFRLLAVADTGGGVEASSVETDGLFKDLFATEMGEGSDCLVAKIEMPTKGGGMKLWT